MRIYISQLRQELTVMIRNGEQLLLLVVIPVALLVFFSQTDFLPTGNENKIDFLLPGILSLAVISTAMVSLGIATGFERSYGVLRRLGTTPLGTRRLVAAKISAICIIEIAQLVHFDCCWSVIGLEPESNQLATSVGFYNSRYSLFCWYRVDTCWAPSRRNESCRAKWFISCVSVARWNTRRKR